MLISDSHRFIFVHVRKAAGTSIRAHLQPYALPRRRGLPRRILSRLGLLNHYHRHAFRGHAPLREAWRGMPRDRFEAYFKFAFVRNPWERLVSEYEFIRANPRHPRHAQALAVSFPTFVRFQARRREAHESFQLRGPDGRVGVDFLGRLENLQEDFDAVCARLAIPGKALAHLNRGASRDYRRYYDAPSRELVAERWSEIIALCGYAFDDRGCPPAPLG